jgi:hypothetical protein
MFQVDNRFRNGRLGHREMLRRFCHAAVLHNGEERVQVPQSQAFADAGILGVTSPGPDQL